MTDAARDGMTREALRRLERTGRMPDHAVLAADMGHPADTFATQDALDLAVCQEGFAAFASAFDAAQGLSDRDRLIEGGCIYIRFARERPAIFRLIFAGPPPPLPDGEEDGWHGFLEMVGDAAWAPADDPRVRRSAVALWSLVHGYASLSLAGQIEEVAPTGAEEESLGRAIVAAAVDRLMATGSAA